MAVQFDNLGDVKPKVTAGGKNNTKFVPNLNVSFFDDEFYFNLNRKDKIIKNEKAATASGKTSLGGIDTDIWYIDDKGRLKWDIEFTSRPAVNSWTWELKHTKGIEFYYQDALTAEEIAEGCERPDEVVGSYAVYCNKSNNKYKTGKLCHIYRPFCYDAKGKTIYAELNIADGQMTISIDAAWLDSAAYPVRLDPTIGYTTAGGTSSDRRLVVLQVAAMPAAGTLSTMYGYAKKVALTAGLIKVGVYNDNSGVPGTLFDGADEISVPSTTGAWYSSSGAGSLSSGSKYYPAITNNIRAYIYYDSSSDNSNWYAAGSYGMADNPSLTEQDRKYSAYFEYTESVASSGGSLVGASALVGGGVLCGQGNLIN